MPWTIIGQQAYPGHSHLSWSLSQVLTLWCRGEAYEFSKPVIKSWARTGSSQSVAGTVLSPLPGRVIKVSHIPCL